jgi:hypothetical protein
LKKIQIVIVSLLALFACLLWPVQAKALTPVTTCGATFTNAVPFSCTILTSANQIIVVQALETTGSSPTCSGGGLTWTTDAFNSGGIAPVATCHALTAATFGNITVTMSFPGQTGSSGGFAATYPSTTVTVEAVSFLNGTTSTSPVSGGSVTTASAADLIVSYFFNFSTITVTGSNFTVLATGAGSSQPGLAWIGTTSGAPGSYTPNVTYTGTTSNWAFQTVAYKLSTSGSGLFPHHSAIINFKPPKRRDSIPKSAPRLLYAILRNKQGYEVS